MKTQIAGYISIAAGLLLMTILITSCQTPNARFGLSEECNTSILINKVCENEIDND